MLLYITAEDVFGDAPAPGAPRPQPRAPATLAALFDQGMRHHQRRAVLHCAELGAVPDWKLDRLAIRIALYCREKLGLEPGSRAAVFGRPGWLWPAVEAAVQGWGATAVGIAHDAPDDVLLQALREAAPRFVVATDALSATRLLELRTRGLAARVPLVAPRPATPAGEALALELLLELGGTFDTAERAQAFRLMCRLVEPETEALWHVSASGTGRLTHAQAVKLVSAWLRTKPQQQGDVVQLLPTRVTLGLRVALAACVGDGRSEIVLGEDGAASAARLRPHGLRASASWLDEACRGCEPRWPAALRRRGSRQRLQHRLGERLRWVEAEGRVDEATARALAAAGVELTAEETG
jgi:AMP-binding enzyme